MILIVGLGNPGKKYEQTRHNAGFLALEKFKDENAEFFSPWQEVKKFKSLVSESSDKKIKLILPQTFMNNSGEAVSALVKFYKINLNNIWVVYDDLDVELGKIKVQINRSAAGHKGIESIITQLGSQNFIRFRIGVKPLLPTKEPNEKKVLKKFTKEEMILLEKSLEKTVRAIQECLKNGLEKTMTKFNS